MTLELHDLSLTAPGAAAPLFAPLSLRIAPGEIACLTGPSGVGKSSLIAGIAGQLPRGFVLSGQVRLNGRDLLALPPERRGVGVIFQQALLFPHLSVGDNLAFGLSPEFRGRTARRAAVSEALERAGLPGYGARDPATLSGGQRARVALMRALLAQPGALLLDEPFAALDPALRAGMRDFVAEHLRAAAIPALLVSHDAQDAAVARQSLAIAPLGAGG
ncbi:ATP-binding cassette domain-containing protein [Sedimentimonas flavescens]|uniref:ATP-binding cassette domain-containing protein n=1 Tax=Sedimentimonas flavescens TaxID=2851012 RepID=A0ABT2ZU23_9RHOB|nr:ATP-binding cassette domain-containing protein [Sedimentimonas flavescens]MCV2877259.1 ATP-binding cassette domain-containing protein [Sedimentimonas flavescens]